MSGITIRAAGVVPYVVRPGHGVYFLLQDIVNGSRAGKLCDFGGRCEASDANAFVTAARELNEETGFAFGGDVDEVASALRSSSSVRILNRLGRYVCFFLKMEHAVDTSLMPPVDHSADDSAERRFRWWRADELLGQVHEDQLLERMLAPSPVLPPLSGPTAGRSPSDGSSSDRPLSSFHKAICKTLALENAHPDAHGERLEGPWDARVWPANAARSPARPLPRPRARPRALHRTLHTAPAPLGAHARVHARVRPHARVHAHLRVHAHARVHVHEPWDSHEPPVGRPPPPRRWQSAGTSPWARK